MPGPYGLTPSGFVLKTLQEILAELETDYKTAFGTSVGSNPDGSIPAQTAMGQQIGIMAERFAALWELAQAVNSSTDPDKAEDASLDALCALTGTLRGGAAPSQAVVTCTGDPGTNLPINRVVSVQGANTRFDLAAGSLVALPVWATATAYAVGDRVSSGARAYHCTVAGTSASAPTGTGGVIVDGSVTWAYLGEGVAAGDFAAIAEKTGPLAALSGTLNKIETPVSGWKSATNLLDATIGTDYEKNADLRIKRENELQGAAFGALNAIRAHILRVGLNTINPVTACIVFENPLKTTSIDGLPPSSIEALVKGGTDADVRRAVFEAVDGGIETFGNNSGTVTDSAGIGHTIKFSRAIEVPIWLEIDVTKDPLTFPLDGEAQIKAAILADFPYYIFGRDVTAWRVKSTIKDIVGVLNVTALRLGLSAGPITITDIQILTRQIATFDSSRILVTLTDGTP